MDARLIVGMNFARIRAAKGISQTQLAARIDPAKMPIDQSYISKIEKGNVNVTILTLATLAEALGVSLADLVDEEAAARSAPV